ncbi:hypothetical protein TCAL_05518 [Tigriopus californicus]|uniref:Uncharacterized protein n=1 Tax=Tigriopus californicus TaxID=6832 RepID=A0A553NR18_TIGCA|nr:hypothetical protein TCAL_05518 [Tigriopus californicus]
MKIPRKTLSMYLILVILGMTFPNPGDMLINNRYIRIHQTGPYHPKGSKHVIEKFAQKKADSQTSTFHNNDHPFYQRHYLTRKRRTLSMASFLGFPFGSKLFRQSAKPNSRPVCSTIPRRMIPYLFMIRNPMSRSAVLHVSE